VRFYDPERHSDATFARDDDAAARAVLAWKDRTRFGRGWRRRQDRSPAKSRPAR
jgi:hypothetical protein